MFNDKYILTDAVLEGRKTLTRRLVPISPYMEHILLNLTLSEEDKANLMSLSKYKIGEEVAIAQCYKDVGLPEDEVQRVSKDGKCKLHHLYVADAGWRNKMFVKADLMPHRIKITNIRIERLQDISDEDCLKEGVQESGFSFSVDRYFVEGIKMKGTTLRYTDEKGEWWTFKWQTYEKPREAFAALIDKVSGKGTWEKNPYVFVYEFELVR